MNGWWLPLEHRRFWTLLSVAIVAIVIAGSLTPAALPRVAHIGDKWQHGTSYFLLATWFVGLAPRRTYPWIASGLVLLGLGLELLQHSVTVHRVADARDMTANSLGVAAGMVAAHVGLGAWAQRVEAWLAQRK